jgi:hypothetical protein
MVVLIDGVRYVLVRPEEAVLEKAIKTNCEHIFGQDSFYFDLKGKISSRAGIGTIPDGYVIFFDPKPKWAIVEVELASHPVYAHLIPQLTKFNRAIEDGSTRRKLVDTLYTSVNNDEVLRARLKQKIESGELHKFVYDLIAQDPLIIVAIDQASDELEEALRDIRREIRVLEFKTFRREGITDELNAYVFEPICIAARKCGVKVAMGPRIGYRSRGRKQTIIQAMYALFDEKGVDEVTYAECETLARQVKPDTKFGKTHFSWYKNKYREVRSGGLPEGLKLHNKYKKVLFTAEVIAGGRIKFDGQVYNSPSRAAVAAIQSTGSPRKTEDGWRWWRFMDTETGEEKLIDVLRTR